MTREQAINYLYSSGMSEEQVNSVVSALEQEPCEDAISREDALKCFEELHQTETLAVGYIRSRIRQLPSVNPTHKHVEPTQKNNDNTLDALGDAISREAVLDGLRGCICDEWVKTLFATMVKQLPSVTPSRHKGHWIEEDMWDDIAYRCSECDEVFCLIDGTPELNDYHYCPNCGTEMVEPQESEEQTE